MVAERLIIQSHGAGDDWYVPWFALSRPIHERYAAECDADYLFFAGQKDWKVHPAWNRLPMILDAFDAGYRKVVWLDADTLVVDSTQNIFTATDDSIPLQMRRTGGFPWVTPDGEQEGWNDGVLVVNNVPGARTAIEWVWARRHDPPAQHHMPSLWELNHLLDLVLAQPDLVADLPDRWNWMRFEDASPEADAAICAWHGYPHDERWAAFIEKYESVYGKVPA